VSTGAITTSQGPVLARKNHRRGLTVVLTALALLSCGDQEAPTIPRQLDRAYLTGAAEQALQPDGRFAFPDSVVSPVNQLNEGQARSLALMFVDAFASSLRDSWSELHGAKVDTKALKVCDRALYAMSPYTSFSRDVSELVSRTFGPHWVVPMCGDNERVQVVISFSALATEMLSDPKPNEARPWERGHFGSFGVPANAKGELYSPEAAVETAFNHTRQRVTQIPLLVMSPRPKAPGLVRWRIELEAPVTVVGSESRASRSVRSIWVGFGSVLGLSGLLDRKPNPQELLEWQDKDGRSFSVTLSPLAPAGVEMVEVGGRP
jgi:hypothetical protein